MKRTVLLLLAGGMAALALSACDLEGAVCELDRWLCNVSEAFSTPYSFADVTLFRREADDGATDLVMRYGIANRTNRSISSVRTRADLFQGSYDPQVLLSVDTETSVAIEPGQSGVVEVVLNPFLHFDPRSDIFLDGVTIRRIDYQSGEPWKDPLGLLFYPYRVPLTEGTH